MEIALNPENKLFVISTGNSVSELGFSVVYEQARELMARVSRIIRKLGTERQGGIWDLYAKLLPVQESDIGTLSQYEQYSTLLSMYRQLGDKETWYDARTPKEVRRVLERYRSNSGLVRVFTGDSITGRDFMEENDTIGRIGRSPGPMMVPLLIEDGEYGGGALLTHCIVRIVDIATGIDVYRHPAYHQPQMRLVDAPGYDRAEGFTHNVEEQLADGEWTVCERFETKAKACHWMAFMAGESHNLHD